MPKCKKHYRNKEKYHQYNRRYKKKYYAEGRKNCHAHLWTDSEIQMILDPNRLPDREISKITGHSLTAIQVKRSKLKKEMAEIELDKGKKDEKVINENNMFSITNYLMAQVVNEEDEFIMKVIENYVRDEQLKGKLVRSTIIPEGKLRHILNLGLCLYNTQNKSKLDAAGLFPETMYVEYLRKELEKAWGENQKLRNQIHYMESGIEVIDLSNQE